MGLSTWSSTFIALTMLLCAAACWFTGAYRRLKQLRASKRKALGYVLQHWSQEMDLLKSFFPDSARTGLRDAQIDQQSAAWKALYASMEQVKTCTGTLTGAAGKAGKTATPLEDLEALRTARLVLLESWQRLENSTADLAGARIPEDMQLAWKRTEAITSDKIKLYNQRVSDYNSAIAQWPASLLCRPYGFQKATQLL